MALKLTFWGGAGKVTGANFLVSQGESQVLVDCGIEQGRDHCEECAYEDFPYDPKKIKALVVTHAHLDHIGRIPRLVRAGFSGPIYTTPPTRDLTELMLRDSIDIIAEEAKRGGRAPLYEAQDVIAALALCKPLEYHERREIAPSVYATLYNTGHILGSAGVRLEGEDGTTLMLTGDIGNSPSPLLPNWEVVADVDALVMESVYGDKLHPPHESRVDALQKLLVEATARGGAVMIPAFSLERTQLMLYEISNFMSAGLLPSVSVYLDSPLAIKVTEFYKKWGPTYFSTEAKREISREGDIFNFPFLKKTSSQQESLSIAKAKDPKIIIAGAGMSHGGRIGRHEIRHLPDPRATLVIVGYQAPGSPGRLLEEGAESVTLNGQRVTVRAKVVKLLGWSAHADRDGLLEYVEKTVANGRVKAVFTALGEPASARFLAQRIHDYLGVRAVAPEAGQSWEISKQKVTKLS